MFFANTPYSEVRESLKNQTLDDKQTFLESMIHYFLNLDQADHNRLHEIEGAIDSILEQEYTPYLSTTNRLPSKVLEA